MNIWLFLAILIFAWFGELLLRYDILVLFLIGVFIARNSDWIQKNKWQIMLIILLAGAVFVKADLVYIRHALSIVLFILVIEMKVVFLNVGAYSYTLHLYHSPIVVVTYIFANQFIDNPYLLIVVQLVVAYLGCYLLLRLIQRFKLGFIIGYR